MVKLSANHIWLLLLGATGITWWVGESGQAGQASAVPVIVVFLLSFLKGRWVIDEFMGLRRAPAVWRRLLLGWLTLVNGSILLAYWIGRI